MHSSEQCGMFPLLKDYYFCNYLVGSYLLYEEENVIYKVHQKVAKLRTLLFRFSVATHILKLLHYKLVNN